jgi:uncharacterized UPF0146 family protein
MRVYASTPLCHVRVRSEHAIRSFHDVVLGPYISATVQKIYTINKPMALHPIILAVSEDLSCNQLIRLYQHSQSDV